MQIQHITYIAVLVGMLSCANAAKDSPAEQQGNTQPFNLARLESERTAWERQAIAQYRFTAQSYSTAAYTIPIIVTVLPDAEPELSYIPEGERRNKAGDELIQSGTPFPPFTGKTIDELYISIESDMKYYINTKHKTGILYNQMYHYPENVFVYIESAPGGENGFSLSITQFEDMR